MTTFIFRQRHSFLFFLERHTKANGFLCGSVWTKRNLAETEKVPKQWTQRDQELLDKQLRQLSPYPRGDGVLILAMLAVFFSGMALGGFLFAYENEPVQIALNDAPHAILNPNGTSSTTWR